jgi:hypothetical protein
MIDQKTAFHKQFFFIKLIVKKLGLNKPISYLGMTVAYIARLSTVISYGTQVFKKENTKQTLFYYKTGNL